VTCLYFGDFAGAHDHFQKTIELYDQARHADFANRFGADPRATTEIFDALALWILGQIDDTLRLADRCITAAALAAHARTLGRSLLFAAGLGLVRCHPDAVATSGRAFAECVPRYDLPALFAGPAALFRAWKKWSDTAEKPRLAEMRKG